MAGLEIRQFLCRSDNFGVILHDPQAGVTAAIDTPEESAVREELKRMGLKLTHIFVTHNHFDHIDGVEAIKRDTGCVIYAPARDAGAVPGMDHGVQEGDHLKFGNFELQVLETPGHTMGHVTYFIPGALPQGASGCHNVAFTGDTLFSVGCGRVIEGQHGAMWHSLQKIAALPSDTLIYCGHEYTQSNIAFALSVEPHNVELQKRKAEVDRLREELKSTLPVSLAKELETNPFLRVKSPEIRASLGVGADEPDAKVFEDLRRRKDHF
jgi:hydroxyacylglutathione hydrolase